MKFTTTLSDILDSLKKGRLDLITIENSTLINKCTIDLLSKETHDVGEITKMGLIINISNILYNNTDKSILPLEDGVYDLLSVLYKKYNQYYQVGATPINFEQNGGITTDMVEKRMRKPIRDLSKEKEEFLYMSDLMKTPDLNIDNYFRRPLINYNGVELKKNINTQHKYPKLVGTLNKCKFVLNCQAKERGVFENSNVEIFERDFIQKHIEAGILNPDRKFYLVAELKYDGISVEAEVSDRILSARSRGDTNNNIAIDLTPVLGGHRFKRMESLEETNIFGMKFEAIVTYPNLRKLSEIRGKNYVNARNAIIGITGSLDAHTYKDYITLIPLATSLEVDRLTEIEFMNKYYNSGEYLRYAVLYGDYKEILYQVKKFVEEAEYLRTFIPFMYDGIVLSYIEPDLIDALGRKNSVNLYSVAIKFNALKKQTRFVGYTYSVGQNGVITPMIHYNPVEFYGTIHTKSTGHSFKRFVDLGLKIGDIIDIEYTHDVMPYVSKPDIEENKNNPYAPVEFIEFCPSCGNQLRSSDSGKTIICDNKHCPERNIARMTNMLQKLDLKDFSEETLRSLSKFSLTELFNLTREDILFLGEINSIKFIQRIDKLKEDPIYDYKIIGSLGFTSIANEKWKLVLSKISIYELLYMPGEKLKVLLSNVKGIGPITIETILDEREFFLYDLITISKMKNIIKSSDIKFGKTIRFSGIRDKELSDKLNNMGHDANPDGNVTKTTDILIIPNESYTSSKTSKIGEQTIIATYEDFVTNMDKYL